MGARGKRIKGHADKGIGEGREKGLIAVIVVFASVAVTTGSMFFFCSLFYFGRRRVRGNKLAGENSAAKASAAFCRNRS
jgi:hypothetical protein